MRKVMAFALIWTKKKKKITHTIEQWILTFLLVFFGDRTSDVGVMTMVTKVTLQKFEGVGYLTKPAIKYPLLTGSHRYWQCQKWKKELPFLAPCCVICRNSSRLEQFPKAGNPIKWTGWMKWTNTSQKTECVYPIDMGGGCSALLGTRKMQINHKEERKQEKGMELEITVLQEISQAQTISQVRSVCVCLCMWWK